MIENIGKEWDRVNHALTRGESLPPQELRALRESVQGIREVLKQMCQVSVTRTTLKSAVREALVAVLKEEAPLMTGSSPEVGTQLERLETDVRAVDGRLERVTDRLEKVTGRLDQVDGSACELKDRLHEIRQGLGEVNFRVAEVEASMMPTVNHAVNSTRAEVGRDVADLEARLEKEIEDMVGSIAEKLSELRDMVARVEGLVPRRETLDSVDGRLGRLEESFSGLLTPELRALGEKFSALSTRITAISTDVGQVEGTLTGKLVELQSLLDSGIQRWEADQSHMLERLSTIRDSLRDQLRMVGDNVSRVEGGLLGKITGKRGGGVKLSREEWEQMSERIEGVISGLESILAKTH